jgi:uncharacterized membrane protein
MNETVMQFMHSTVVILEIVSAILLMLGFFVATIIWAKQSLADGKSNATKAYRQALGRTILIALEVLVAATVIKTVTLTPTAESMGILVAMVAIRTAIGWTTSLEMNGRWPWKSKN